MSTTRHITIATIVVALFALACLVGQAQAGSPRVIASSHSSGDFAVTATNATANHASALWVRGYGHGLSAFVVTACSKGFSVGSKSQQINAMASGRLYPVKLPFAGDCQVTASLSGSGSIKLQVLR